MTTAAEIGNAAIREAVESGLAECTEPQQALFHRIYPNLSDSELSEAYDLIQRTLRKNRTVRS